MCTWDLFVRPVSLGQVKDGEQQVGLRVVTLHESADGLSQDLDRRSGAHRHTPHRDFDALQQLFQTLGHVLGIRHQPHDLRPALQLGMTLSRMQARNEWHQ